jgi:hypothetical protein
LHRKSLAALLLTAVTHTPINRSPFNRLLARANKSFESLTNKIALTDSPLGMNRAEIINSKKFPTTQQEEILIQQRNVYKISAPLSAGLSSLQAFVFTRTRMRFIVVVLLALCAAVAAEEKSHLDQINECIEETGVSKEVADKLKDGDFSVRDEKAQVGCARKNSFDFQRQ